MTKFRYVRFNPGNELYATAYLVYNLDTGKCVGATALLATRLRVREPWRYWGNGGPVLAATTRARATDLLATKDRQLRGVTK